MDLDSSSSLMGEELMGTNLLGRIGVVSGVLLLCFCSESIATTIDGLVGLGEYGGPLAVQDTPTGYGDTDWITQFGSELDAVYAKLVSGGGMDLALTGNLEDGTGNAYVIFLDVRAGGAVDSILTGGYGQLGSFGGRHTDDWGNDVDGGPGVSTTPGGPSILDPDFDPDIAIEVDAGNAFGAYFVNIIDMTLLNDVEANLDVDHWLGEASNTLDGTAVTQVYTRKDGDTAKGSGGTITHAFDNSNTGGVLVYDFGSAPGPLGDPLTAMTGFEAHLSGDFLKVDPGHEIKILPFISNASGEYLSNQFLPGLGGISNLDAPGGLGGVPLFDAREFAGDQFLIVVPEPTTFALAAIGLAGILVTRRRRS